MVFSLFPPPRPELHYVGHYSRALQAHGDGSTGGEDTKNGDGIVAEIDELIHVKPNTGVHRANSKYR